MSAIIATCRVLLFAIAGTTPRPEHVTSGVLPGKGAPRRNAAAHRHTKQPAVRVLNQSKPVAYSNQSAIMRGAILRSLQRTCMTHLASPAQESTNPVLGLGMRHVVQQARSLADAQPEHRPAAIDAANSEVNLCSSRP